MSIPSSEMDVKMLIQSVNYSFNPDDPDTLTIENSGPYEIDTEILDPTIYIMIRGPEELKSCMWSWLMFAKDTLTELSSTNWPGSHYKIFMPCPLTIGKTNARMFDHGSEPTSLEMWSPECQHEVEK